MANEGYVSVQRYAIDHVDVWSHNMGTFSEKDVLLFCSLDRRARPASIETELEKRKTHDKATALYLETPFILNAPSSSTSTLAAIKLADANAEMSVNVWESLFNSNPSAAEMASIPQECKLWLLLTLFRDPVFALKVGRQCMNSFGCRIEKVPPEQTCNVLLQYDPKVFAKKKTPSKKSGKPRMQITKKYI